MSYYSRSRKQDREDQGMTYRPLKELLDRSEVVFACLNKNVILLHEKEFRQLGQGKLLFNTSIGPAFDLPALKHGWIREIITSSAIQREPWETAPENCLVIRRILCTHLSGQDKTGL